MNKLLRELGSDFERVFNGYYGYYDEPTHRHHTSKQYTNKNANIEYYTDEHGNIRKRKVSK